MSVFSSQIYEKTSEFKLIHVNHSYQYDYAAFHHSNLNWGPVTGLTQRGRTDKWTQKFRQAYYLWHFSTDTKWEIKKARPINSGPESDAIWPIS